MARSGTTAAPWWRRVLPWVLAWAAVQAAVRVGGVVAARRRDAGDETSSAIHRVVTQRRAVLRPTAADLHRVDLELAMAGVELDLTGLPARPPAGVEVRVRALMAGLDVTVPAGWSVWWESAGAGGIGADRRRPPVRAASPAAADVRVHGTFLLGGAGIAVARG